MLLKRSGINIDVCVCVTFSVLRAINDDSSTVPGLLTDYILKGENPLSIVTDIPVRIMTCT